MTFSLSKQLRQFAASRHNQRKSAFFVAEGLRCCREALTRQGGWLEAAVESEAIAGTPAATEFETQVEKAGHKTERIPEAEFAQLAMTEGPQGVLCVMRKPEPWTPTQLPRPCALILDQVREPGNFGTILRTAWAIGLQQVWLTSGSADPWSPKVIRSGMGAQFALQLAVFPDLPAAAAAFRALGGSQIWCAMMHAEVSMFAAEFTPVGGAIVMGNEANGITHPEVGRAVSIPMPGAAESLNVAQAATLLLYEALRRQ